MTTVYLIRHGEAEGNIYRRAHGQYNSGLTALGLRQVEALGRRFQSVPLDAVYSSDLSRAMYTAAALCRPKGLPVNVDARLREVNVGPWEDQSFGTIKVDQPEQYAAFTNYSPEWQLPGADTVETLSARGKAAIREIAARHPGGAVAICTHGMLLRSSTARLTCGLDHIDQIPFGTNTAVSKLSVEDGIFTPEYLNDVSHLGQELLNLPRRAGDMCIRPMAQDAAEEYIRYRKDAWQVVYGTLKGFDGPGFWLDARRTVGPDPDAMVVSYLSGAPTGMIQLSPDRDADKGVGYIPFLYLREPYRHQGLGIQLIGHAISFYRKRGRTRLQLSVAPTNENALGFYYKYGFVQAKKHRGLFGRLLLLEKDITLMSPPTGLEIRTVTPS